MREAIDRGLTWLAAHRGEDGHWGVDVLTDDERARTLFAGREVGVTGLALLAFVRDGNTTEQGHWRAVVRAASGWLVAQQDADSGLVGEHRGHAFLYDHAIATAALCELLARDDSLELRAAAERAVGTCLRARNPYGAWRYDLPPIGDNDTSVTTWMVRALDAAQRADLAVDPAAFRGARDWIAEVTDPASGRVGYDSIGSRSSRVPGVNTDHPPEAGEAMTAAGLYSSFLLGAVEEGSELRARQTRLLLGRLPEWDPDGLTCDMYYWHHGTEAMERLGGDAREAWETAMVAAALDSQRRDGPHAGSWDPVGPWGKVGGRVYATALMVMSLEVCAP